MRFSGMILLLLFSGLLIADPITEGGNVTQVDFSGMRNTTNWDGVYGEVVLGAGTNYSVSVVGNQVVELNMVAQDPPCTYSSIRMHVIAVNSTGVATPLSAGNLATLDAFIGNLENGSNTFNSTSTFQLTYGTFAGVPTTYTMSGNATSPDFRMGYLNDALGNLVFVAVVVNNRPDWNWSTSDYQIMLPNNGSTTQYTLWVDVNYTCKSNVTPPEHDNDHVLYIPPISTYTVQAGEGFNVNLVVENRGDYTEYDVDVFADNCPGGFTCGSTNINHIIVGDDKALSLPFVADGPGDYVVEICAENDDVDYCREFLIHVSPECGSNADCPVGEYCDGGECAEEKENEEECVNNYECKSGMCEGGKCSECESNSDCANEEVCSSGMCKRIECVCGYIMNHACMEPECCSDSDCVENEICYRHECVPKELDIVIIDGTLVEGEPLLVQIVDNLGNPVPGAAVTADGQGVIADQNGYATVATPYDGLIFGEKEGYGKVGEILSVTRLGFFVFEDEVYAGKETVIRLVDSRGNPIAGAEVIIDGEKYTTDAQGRIFHTFGSPGKKELGGNKAGYRINPGALNVREGGWGMEVACLYPLFLGWFEFTYANIYVLWIFSILMALVNLFLFRGRTGMSYARSIVYSFVPVVLAIPNYWILNICFMSNVITVQLIIEAALILKKILLNETDEAAEGKLREESELRKMRKKHREG